MEESKNVPQLLLAGLLSMKCKIGKLSFRVSQFFTGGKVYVGRFSFAELLVDDEILDTATKASFCLAEEVDDLICSGNEEHGEFVFLGNCTAEEL